MIKLQKRNAKSRTQRPKRKRQPAKAKSRTKRPSNRGRAVSRPSAMGRVTMGTYTSQRTRISGTEPLGTVTVVPVIGTTQYSYAPGHVLYDLKVMPRYIGGPNSRLANVSRAYSNHKFRSLRFRVVSNLSSNMMGGMTWAVTRDMGDINWGTGASAALYTGYPIPGALTYAQSCGTSIDVPLWQSASLTIPCGSANSRQKLYANRLNGDLEEACEFRILGVVSSAPGVVGTYASSISVSIYLDYEVDLVGSEGTAIADYASTISPSTSNASTLKMDDHGVITDDPVGVAADEVYFVNPALPVHMTATTSSTTWFALSYANGKTAAFSTCAAALSNVDRSNMIGTNLQYCIVPAASHIFKVGDASYETNPSLRQLRQELDVVMKQLKIESQPVAEEKKIEKTSNTTPSEPAVDERQEHLKRIVARNERMTKVIPNLLTLMSDVLEGNITEATKTALNSARTAIAVGAEAASDSN